ncbi:hypothetical protein GCM10007940_19280 [Portibacter lacus]|uniref:Carboxypeptidase-like regulatory domain-containing protein n=2 Tax=Portibacter lacus TaxID=1099794 RepID=A0AA37SSG5_9BACT|nr:hypothetical protein GCM10007940_19280 [Portibacter lacus]
MKIQKNTIMKSLLLLFVSFIAFNISAQIQLEGKIIDSKTSQPQSYVNIGVIGKNIGTVSDRNGYFSLLVPEENYSDKMRISMIGYESIEMQVNEIENLLKSNKNIDLNPSNYEIEEVVISATNLKSKEVGNLKPKKNIFAAFGEDKLGNEMGIVIKIKKRRTILKDVSFALGENLNDTVRFRLNIYDMEKGKPGENLLKENIIIETSIEKGIVKTDLSKYDIVVEDDFLLSIEWIEDYPKDTLSFGATLFNKSVWVRETSQADLVKIPILGIGLSATILY